LVSTSLVRAALLFMATSPYFGVCHRIMTFCYRRAEVAGCIDLNQH
jgi:hypothetical protein